MAILPALVIAVSASAQSSSVTLPAGTLLSAGTDRHVPLRIGQPIHSTLLYPVYHGTDLVLPSHTAIDGRVIALRSDRARRIRSAFNLDFTPFHIPIVQFTSLTLPGGEIIPITSEPTGDGVTLLRFSAAPSLSHQNVVHRESVAVVHLARNTLSFFTAPGKGDRLLQLVYHQLPWHPQRIADNTAWTAEISAPIVVPHLAKTPAATGDPAEARTIEATLIEATLDEALSSAKARPGDVVHATVTVPFRDADANLSIRQGATLEGLVTECRPSRGFGRDGSLRFAFHRVILPSGEQQPIVANLSAVDSSAGSRLALDSEGAVRPQPHDRIIVPALLVGLAVAPLNPDPTDHDEFIKNGGASNSLGVMGFVAGLAYNGARLSAALGFYGLRSPSTTVGFAAAPTLTFRATPASWSPPNPGAPRSHQKAHPSDDSLLTS